MSRGNRGRQYSAAHDDDYSDDWYDEGESLMLVHGRYVPANSSEAVAARAAAKAASHGTHRSSRSRGDGREAAPEQPPRRQRDRESVSTSAYTDSLLDDETTIDSGTSGPSTVLGDYSPRSSAGWSGGSYYSSRSSPKRGGSPVRSSQQRRRYQPNSIQEEEEEDDSSTVEDYSSEEAGPQRIRSPRSSGRLAPKSRFDSYNSVNGRGSPPPQDNGEYRKQTSSRSNVSVGAGGVLMLNNGDNSDFDEVDAHRVGGRRSPSGAGMRPSLIDDSSIVQPWAIPEGDEDKEEEEDEEKKMMGKENQGGRGTSAAGFLSSSQKVAALGADDTSQSLSHDGSESTNFRSPIDPSLALHELVGEPTKGASDPTWIAALEHLVKYPGLAKIPDPNLYHWTPLHIACLSNAPLYMIRALILVHPGGVRERDLGGRTPLHLAAGSGASNGILRTLIREWRDAIFTRDAKGLIPLHLLLKNGTVPRLDSLRILLGQENYESWAKDARKQKRMSLRKGEHLVLTSAELEEALGGRSPSSSPKRRASGEVGDDDESSVLESLWNDDATINNDKIGGGDEPQEFEDDVKRLTQKLVHWKKRKKRLDDKTSLHADNVEVGLDGGILAQYDGNEDESEEVTNPAAIAAPPHFHLPLHMAVRRAYDSQGGDDSSTPGMANDVDKEKQVLDWAHTVHRCDVVRILINAYPPSLLAQDSLGRTPLMVSLLNREKQPDLEIVELLLGVRTAGYEEPPAWMEDLMLRAKNDHSTVIGGRVRAGKYTNPAMLQASDTLQLPLHIAAFEVYCTDIIKTIHRSYPAAIYVEDARRQSPMHCALSNVQGTLPPPAVVSMLLDLRVARIQDDVGKAPLDLMVDHGPKMMFRSVIDFRAEQAEMQAYRPLFEAPFLPKDDMRTLLSKLRRLPPWLRRQACASQAVRMTFFDGMTRPLAVFVILLHGAILVATITIFRLFVDGQYNVKSSFAAPSWHLPALAAFVGYFGLIELRRFVICGSLSVLSSQFFGSIWTWVNISVIALLASILVMRKDLGGTSSDTSSTVGMLATGFLWVKLTGYLSHWWLGIGRFVDIIIKLTQMFLSPLIILSVIVVAIAQLVYTLNHAQSGGLQCPVNASGSDIDAVCTARDSYGVAYLLVLLWPMTMNIAGDEDTAMSTGSIIIVATFTTLIVVVFLSILAFVMIDGKRVLGGDLMMDKFWERIFIFLIMSDVTSGFGCIRRQEDHADDIKKPSNSMQKWDTACGRMWDLLTSSYATKDLAKTPLWYLESRSLLANKWIARAVGTLLIPLWIIVGALTFGLLWPPQIRKWIFYPTSLGWKPSMSNESSRDSAVGQETSAAIRNDMLQLKQMTYERSIELEEELRELKEFLLLCTVQDGN